MFGVDTGLWELMAKNGDQPQKVGELAASLDIDAALLSRFFRYTRQENWLTSFHTV